MPVEYWERVYKTKTCWMWIGHITWRGYGTFTFNKKQVLAHRFIYGRLKDNLIKGMHIHHICRSRACVNPNHLVQVTAQENIEASKPYLPKTHVKKGARKNCIFGHPYTPDNTILLKLGGKICRRCSEKIPDAVLL